MTAARCSGRVRRQAACFLMRGYYKRPAALCQGQVKNNFPSLGKAFSMRRMVPALCAFFLGGGLYGLCELLFRGRTHWTMLLAGGLCLLLLYLAGGLELRLWQRCVLGMAVITAVEFLFGCLLNLRLGLGVWDYSGRFGNLLGQICPLFSLAWLGLSLPASLLCALLRRLFRTEIPAP